MSAAVLILLAVLASQPQPDDVPENLEGQVAGFRYDFSIELAERVDRYGELAQQALRARPEFRKTLDERLDSFVAVQRMALKALEDVERVAAIARQLASRPHPVCAYLADRSGADGLAEGPRAILDVLLARAAGPRGTPLEGCTTSPAGTDPHLQRLCAGLLMGDAAGCPSDVAPELCRFGFDPDPNHPPMPVPRGDLFALVWGTSLRTGSRARLESATAPWFKQMEAAVSAHDPALCPPWIEWRRGHRTMFGVDPDTFFRPVEAAVSLVPTSEVDTYELFYLSQFPAACAVYTVSGGKRQDLAQMVLPATKTGVAFKVVPVDKAGPDERLHVTCSIVAREDPATWPTGE